MPFTLSILQIFYTTDGSRPLACEAPLLSTTRRYRSDQLVLWRPGMDFVRLLTVKENVRSCETMSLRLVEDTSQTLLEAWQQCVPQLVVQPLDTNNKSTHQPPGWRLMEEHGRQFACWASQPELRGPAVPRYDFGHCHPSHTSMVRRVRLLTAKDRQPLQSSKTGRGLARIQGLTPGQTVTVQAEVIPRDPTLPTLLSTAVSIAAPSLCALCTAEETQWPLADLQPQVAIQEAASGEPKLCWHFKPVENGKIDLHAVDGVCLSDRRRLTLKAWRLWVSVDEAASSPDNFLWQQDLPADQREALLTPALSITSAARAGGGHVFIHVAAVWQVVSDLRPIVDQDEPALPLLRAMPSKSSADSSCVGAVPRLEDDLVRAAEPVRLALPAASFPTRIELQQTTTNSGADVCLQLQVFGPYDPQRVALSLHIEDAAAKSSLWQQVDETAEMSRGDGDEPTVILIKARSLLKAGCPYHITAHAGNFQLMEKEGTEQLRVTSQTLTLQLSELQNHLPTLLPPPVVLDADHCAFDTALPQTVLQLAWEATAVQKSRTPPDVESAMLYRVDLIVDNPVAEILVDLDLRAQPLDCAEQAQLDALDLAWHLLKTSLHDSMASSPRILQLTSTSPTAKLHGAGRYTFLLSTPYLAINGLQYSQTVHLSYAAAVWSDYRWDYCGRSAAVQIPERVGAATTTVVDFAKARSSTRAQVAVRLPRLNVPPWLFCPDSITHQLQWSCEISVQNATDAALVVRTTALLETGSPNPALFDVPLPEPGASFAVSAQWTATWPHGSTADPIIAPVSRPPVPLQAYVPQLQLSIALHSSPTTSELAWQLDGEDAQLQDSLPAPVCGYLDILGSTSLTLTAQQLTGQQPLALADIVPPGTSRLQLRLGYELSGCSSLPFTAASAANVALHWLVSNELYVDSGLESPLDLQLVCSAWSSMTVATKAAQCDATTTACQRHVLAWPASAAHLVETWQRWATGPIRPLLDLDDCLRALAHPDLVCIAMRKTDEPLTVVNLKPHTQYCLALLVAANLPPLVATDEQELFFGLPQVLVASTLSANTASFLPQYEAGLTSATIYWNAGPDLLTHGQRLTIVVDRMEAADDSGCEQLPPAEAMQFTVPVDGEIAVVKPLWPGQRYRLQLYRGFREGAAVHSGALASVAPLVVSTLAYSPPQMNDAQAEADSLCLEWTPAEIDTNAGYALRGYRVSWKLLHSVWEAPWLQPGHDMERTSSAENGYLETSADQCETQITKLAYGCDYRIEVHPVTEPALPPTLLQAYKAQTTMVARTTTTARPPHLFVRGWKREAAELFWLPARAVPKAPRIVGYDIYVNDKLVEHVALDAPRCYMLQMAGDDLAPSSHRAEVRVVAVSTAEAMEAPSNLVVVQSPSSALLCSSLSAMLTPVPRLPKVSKSRSAAVVVLAWPCPTTAKPMANPLSPSKACRVDVDWAVLRSMRGGNDARVVLECCVYAPGQEEATPLGRCRHELTLRECSATVYLDGAWPGGVYTCQIIVERAGGEGPDELPPMSWQVEGGAEVPILRAWNLQLVAVKSDRVENPTPRDGGPIKSAARDRAAILRPESARESQAAGIRPNSSSSRRAILQKSAGPEVVSRALRTAPVAEKKTSAQPQPAKTARPTWPFYRVEVEYSGSETTERRLSLVAADPVEVWVDGDEVAELPCGGLGDAGGILTLPHANVRAAIVQRDRQYNQLTLVLAGDRRQHFVSLRLKDDEGAFWPQNYCITLPDVPNQLQVSAQALPQPEGAVMVHWTLAPGPFVGNVQKYVVGWCLAAADLAAGGSGQPRPSVEDLEDSVEAAVSDSRRPMLVAPDWRALVFPGSIRSCQITPNLTPAGEIPGPVQVVVVAVDGGNHELFRANVEVNLSTPHQAAASPSLDGAKTEQGVVAVQEMSVLPPLKVEEVLAVETAAAGDRDLAVGSHSPIPPVHEGLPVRPRSPATAPRHGMRRDTFWAFMPQLKRRQETLLATVAALQERQALRQGLMVLGRQLSQGAHTSAEMREAKKEELRQQRQALRALEKELQLALADLQQESVAVTLNWDLTGHSLRGVGRHFDVLQDGERVATVDKSQHKFTLQLPARRQPFTLALRPSKVRSGVG